MRLFKRKNRLTKSLDLPILSNRQMLDKVLTFISSDNTTKSFEQISNHAFNTWKGGSLDQHLFGILLQLVSDGYVAENIVGVFMNQQKLYTITGKGKSFCNSPRFIYKNFPYAYHNFTRRFENIFTKFLPIIISIISLVVAVLAYLQTIKPK